MSIDSEYRYKKLHYTPLPPLLWIIRRLLLRWRGCIQTLVSLLIAYMRFTVIFFAFSLTTACAGLDLDQESCHRRSTRSIAVVSPSRSNFIPRVFHTLEISVTSIIRAQANNHPGMVDPAAALTVIQVLNRILISPSESPQNQTKACHTLCSYLFSIDMNDPQCYSWQLC